MSDTSVPSLIERCRRGNQTAMQAFYERFYSFALSICLAYANNREDAREMLNDGFLKAFGHLNTLKNDASVMPWLRRILINTAIDYYRKNQARAVEVPAEWVEQSLEEPTLNDEAIFARFSAEHILSVLQQLPIPYRMVFSLYVVEGYAHREIADQLTITESTSRAHLTQATRLLRQALSSQFPTHHERTR